MVLIFDFNPKMPSRSRAGTASFSQEKNSFNSENGGVNEFERDFPLLVFSDQQESESPALPRAPSQQRQGHKSHTQPHMDVAPSLLYGGYNLNLPRLNIPS